MSVPVSTLPRVINNSGFVVYEGHLPDDSVVYFQTVVNIDPDTGLPLTSSADLQYKKVTAEFNRPANTTAYVSNDVVSNSTTAPTLLEFDVARVPGGSGDILQFKIETNDVTDTSRYVLHLFNAPVTAINCNSPMLIRWADRAARVGSIYFDALRTSGSGSGAAWQESDRVLSFICAENDTKLYGILETLTARTPASGQSFSLSLKVAQK
jgi:hypothetical protein